MADPIRATRSGAYLPIAGVRELADRYDAFLVDSYGVLHDGRTLYPGSAECLDALRAAGRTVVVLTNTPRRAAVVSREIEKVGIAARHYDVLVSAGEVTYRMLATRGEQLGLAADAPYYHVGPPRSAGLIGELSYVAVDDLGRASFLLITGFVPGMDEMADYGALLAEARARGVPAVCANPDLVAIRSGQRGGCAGTIADVYRKMGGTVHFFGKPYSEIYAMALAALPGTLRSRVLCVGDALHTDIGGAQDAGLDCLFVAAGVHQEELAGAENGDPIDALFRRNDRPPPTAAIASFRW